MLMSCSQFKIHRFYSVLALSHAANKDINWSDGCSEGKKRMQNDLWTANKNEKFHSRVSRAWLAASTLKFGNYTGNGTQSNLLHSIIHYGRADAELSHSDEIPSVERDDFLITSSQICRHDRWKWVFGVGSIRATRTAEYEMHEKIDKTKQSEESAHAVRFGTNKRKSEGRWMETAKTLSHTFRLLLVFRVLNNSPVCVFGLNNRKEGNARRAVRCSHSGFERVFLRSFLFIVFDLCHV